MNRAFIPALALAALLPLASLAAGDDQKPAVQKPDAKRDAKAKDTTPCCSQKDGKGDAPGMHHDMQNMHHDQGGTERHGDHSMMHDDMPGESGPHGGDGHGM